MTIYWISGFVAVFFVGHARRIAWTLHSRNPEVLEAASTYPSLILVGSGWLREGITMLAALLGMLAWFAMYYATEGITQTLETMPLFGFPYIVLAFCVWQPLHPTFVEQQQAWKQQRVEGFPAVGIAGGLLLCAMIVVVSGSIAIGAVAGLVAGTSGKILWRRHLTSQSSQRS